MSFIPILAVVIRAVWSLCEAVRLRREKKSEAETYDRHSSMLWDVAIGLELIGIVFGFTAIGRIQSGRGTLMIIGPVLLIFGIAIRWAAIFKLGRYFTGKVLIRKDHQLIRTGLYKYVRHPAYAGSLIAHVGLGLSLGNWVSLGCSFIPFCVAAFYRMHVEDEALNKKFGQEYLDYSITAKRLIPKLY